MDFGDNPDPTKFNCFYHNNWFDTPEEYTVEIDMESGCSGVKGGHFNHDTKEWDAGCEDPSESLGFTGCYATNYSDEKYDGEEKGDPACPADGLCYLNSYDFEAGPVCC
jgi:hypothetical protein